MITGQITPEGARSGESRRSKTSNDTFCFTAAAAASPGPEDMLLRIKYRELTRKHLNGLLPRLFAEFTGLRFHIIWAPSLLHDWNAPALPPGCSVCRRVAQTIDGAARGCRSCGPQRLIRALRANGNGHRFLCRLGVRNYWFPIRVRGVTVGIAYLQALERRTQRASASKASASAATSVSDSSSFNRASRLLRLMVQHVQTLDLAELRQADLANAQSTVTVLENERARLRKELDRIVPATARTPARGAPETHAEQIVHRLLEQVQGNYAQPITLQECAAGLAMNAAYLSTLFSNTVGMPFKAYLTELRLEKARQLLLDPAKSISEVAGEVGYASENRFRSAFKKMSGLSPRFWRAAFCGMKLIVLCCLVEGQESVQWADAFFA